MIFFVLFTLEFKVMRGIYKITYKELSISPAADSELTTVLSLLKEAALWLKTNNIDYWSNWIDPEEKYISWIKEGFDNNEFFIVRYFNEITGMFRLQWSDNLFWKNKNDEAGYIHSFTTLRKYKGRNIGSIILKWIEDYCRINKKKYLRLDCGAAVNGLNNYYQQQGFLKVDSLNFDHEGHAEKLNLYEKKL